LLLIIIQIDYLKEGDVMTTDAQTELAARSSGSNYLKNIDCCQKLVDRANEINYSLIDLRLQLNDLQPAEVGSIKLSFKNCGKSEKHFCSGCPHPRFMRVNKSSGLKLSSLNESNYLTVKSPLAALKKTGQFERFHAEARDLVLDIQKLIVEREKLNELIVKLRRAADGITKVTDAAT
jgi:hypothetical protein